MQPTSCKGQHRAEHGHQPQPLPALGNPPRPELSAPRHGHISSATEQTPSASLVDASQLIKAHIFMSHVSRKAAPCKLHHLRKLCCSHASLWGIILLLPPFSRAGGNLHCLLSAVYHWQTWLMLQEQRQLFAEQGSPCVPPGLHGCACFPFLLPQAASKSEPAPGKSLSQFASPLFEVCLLFPGSKAPTSSWEMGRVLAQPHTMEKPFAVVSRLDIKSAAESQREVGSTRQTQGQWCPYFLLTCRKIQPCPLRQLQTLATVPVPFAQAPSLNNL